MDIKKILLENQDKKYRDFQIKLIPTVDEKTVIGVRTPELRRLANEFSKTEEVGAFLNSLPHGYFEENQLHAFILSEMKDFDECVKEVSRFLPFVDNWATCDQMSPKVFKKHSAELLNYIEKWLKADEEYAVRFGIKMLMEHFLGENFKPVYAESVVNIRRDKYYIKMMVAWYFATALAKNYDETVGFIKNNRLDRWTHNKAIQKARESLRLTPEQKEYLKQLKL